MHVVCHMVTGGDLEVAEEEAPEKQVEPQVRKITRTGK